VVASDLPDDLAAPSRIADPSWIRPGRVAWSWWSDSWSPHVFADQRDYVDFAHEAGFEYVLVDAGWDPAWVPQLVDYAAERGVRVLLWTDWHAIAAPESAQSHSTSGPPGASPASKPTSCSRTPASAWRSWTTSPATPPRATC